MTRIFWDTNLFIYLFEGDSPFVPACCFAQKPVA